MGGFNYYLRGLRDIACSILYLKEFRDRSSRYTSHHSQGDEARKVITISIDLIPYLKALYFNNYKRKKSWIKAAA